MKIGWLRATGAAALLVGFTAPAMAQIDTATQFSRAIAALDQRLGSAETAPLISTTDAAANAANLASIEQAMDVFGTPAFPVESFNTFESVCSALNRINVRYSLDGMSALRRAAGSPPPDAAQTAALTAQLQSLQMRNAVRHQDAIVMLTTGIMRCTVLHFPVLGDFLANLPPAELTPIRLNGARQMRQGIINTLLGLTTALHEDSTNAVSRQRIVRTLPIVAAPLSAALTPAQRLETRSAIASLPRSADREVEATKAQLITALSAQECTRICLIQ